MWFNARGSRSDSLVVSFTYDAAGNRIEKKVVNQDTALTTVVTRYLRDASGNVMAIYQDSVMTEQPIYGSSRLGMYKGGKITAYRNMGTKRYELTNHLGNVMTVISDNIGMEQDSVWASVVTTSDYYPFGLEMASRGFSDSTYRYGFNGKEKDQEGEFGNTNYDYGFRIYNPGIARFLSVDPLMKSYPMLTPYQFAANSPISGIDQDGLEYVYYLRSPLLSKKFISAHDAGDLYEQRRILNYATHNPFTPQSRQEIDGKVMMSSYQDGDPVGNLVYDETAPKGFTLIPYEWKEEGRIGIMSDDNDIHYPLNEGSGPTDKFFPTDVRENTGFYGDNDFVGEFHGASTAAGPAVKGSGLIMGFVKGWGYAEFTTRNLSGYGLDATLYETGSITGRYIGEGLPSLENFSGPGVSFSFGSGLSTGGIWRGHDKTGKPLWKGSFEGFSIGLPRLKGSGGGIKTETKLLFPKPKDSQ